MAKIEELSGNVKNFAEHLVKWNDRRELHAMVNSIHGDITACTEWGINESEYYEAVDAAYFAKLDEMGY